MKGFLHLLLLAGSAPLLTTGAPFSIFDLFQKRGTMDQDRQTVKSPTRALNQNHADLDSTSCATVLDFLSKVITLGAAAFSGEEEVEDSVTASVKRAKDIAKNGGDAGDFASWFSDPCNPSHNDDVARTVGDIDKVFNTLIEIDDEVVSGSECVEANNRICEREAKKTSKSKTSSKTSSSEATSTTTHTTSSSKTSTSNTTPSSASTETSSKKISSSTATSSSSIESPKSSSTKSLSTTSPSSSSTKPPKSSQTKSTRSSSTKTTVSSSSIRPSTTQIESSGSKSIVHSRSQKTSSPTSRSSNSHTQSNTSSARQRASGSAGSSVHASTTSYLPAATTAIDWCSFDKGYCNDDDSEGSADSGEVLEKRKKNDHTKGNERDFPVKLPNTKDLTIISEQYPPQGDLLKGDQAKDVLHKIFEFKNDDLNDVNFAEKDAPEAKDRKGKYVTEHILELQTLKAFIEAAVTGDLPQSSGSDSTKKAKTAPIAEFFFKNNWNADSIDDKTAKSWGPIGKAEYDPEVFKVPNRRVFTAFGSKQNREDFDLCEKSIDAFKAHAWDFKQPKDGKELDSLMKTAADPTTYDGHTRKTKGDNQGDNDPMAVAFTPLRDTIGVFKYMQMSDVKLRFHRVLANVGKEMGNIASKFPNEAGGLKNMWEEYIAAHLDKIEAEAQKWMRDQVQSAKETFQNSEREWDASNNDAGDKRKKPMSDKPKFFKQAETYLATYEAEVDDFKIPRPGDKDT